MRILTPSATRQLLAQIPQRSPFGVRDHALIRLFAQTGLRVGELTGLDLVHVYDHQVGPRHWLDLPAAICKGHHSRRIPLNDAARQAVLDLVDFLKMRGFQTQPHSPLLQDRRHRRLPVREVQRLVQGYRQLAGLDLRVTPHSFRHAGRLNWRGAPRCEWFSSCSAIASSALPRSTCTTSPTIWFRPWLPCPPSSGRQHQSGAK